MKDSKRVGVIGVPMDLGANRRGVDMGPSAIRATGFVQKLESLGLKVRDFGDIDTPIPEECSIGDPKKKYANAIEKICLKTAAKVQSVLKRDFRPVILGGDHSLAMGSIMGAAAFYRAQKKSLGLIWFDAHGDMNTPQSTKSGNVHGMPFAHVMGMGDDRLAALGGFKPKVSPTRTCLVGVRDIDEREKALIAQSQVKVFTMKEIDRFGISKVMEEVIAIAANGTAGIHVSLDIDVVDPAVAQGVGTPKKGGLSYREIHLAMELVADSGRLTSLDVVEVNPILDVKNATAELASELILSAFGKRIF